MGLAVCVGMLADLRENDPEGADWFRETMTSVNEVLAENNLPQHHEPERLPPLDNRTSLDSYPYSFLHALRRVAAHAADKPGWIAAPFPESMDAFEDPLIEQYSAGFDNHLLCHSDCEGFYLPIRFKSVLVDDGDRLPGGMLGSSYALQEELTALAPSLGIKLAKGLLSDQEADAINRTLEDEGPLWIEKIVWLSLFEAARLSIQHNAAICFS